ncbi:D-arabinose 1-dehydrogenase, Zn-dependent alcohol dehydrogenase family [Austwickia chelonae]|uniref:Putative zinc-containing alcohol dehydrogenase n=1 Tax=Austwickia chelonae NBRC 105200 TaxID=1184607 RepID=K6VPH9_9MICO|nr:zinc-binding dehydrogenase [Austwickia chelonae]GAB77280.1 putative zinc-containing alcohol dehydrogenase [Austwickia chelonae NBRC 105200]SEW06861.1 D-arabinose 1-dehydrogenase, Zn-dependent alcohol dehydrogenase family [Austwickia chelonae]
MVDSMLAARFHSAEKVTRLEEVPVPRPGPGEVLIEVAYCGICHSDISLIDGHFPALLPVVTQGHEASGTIVEVGSQVFGWAVGDRVIPAAGQACFRCRACLRGALANCLDKRLMAFAYDGAWAKYHLAKATGLTRIPEGVPMEQAALLADAVSTPYAAVVRTAQVRLGESVGIWGLGGVGSHLVQLAKLAGGMPIIAVDIDDHALERALRLGADAALRSDDPQLGRQIAELTSGRMLDVAFDAVGIPATLRQSVAWLDTEGRAVSVGMSDAEIEIGPILDFNLRRKQLLGHLGYQTQDVASLAEMVSRGRLDLSESVSSIIALSDIHEGISALRERRGNPIRILVQP